MSPLWRFVVAGAGFAFLAASLATKKRAGWLAVAGVALLGGLAVRESDPVLALGALALAASRWLGPTRQDSRRRKRDPAAAPRPPRSDRP